MNQEKIIADKIINQLRHYADERKENITRGSETPILAALLLQKYGLGLVDAVNIFYDNLRTTDILMQVYHSLDEEISKIDPQWREHNKQRCEGHPADIIIYSKK